MEASTQQDVRMSSVVDTVHFATELDKTTELWLALPLYCIAWAAVLMLIWLIPGCSCDAKKQGADRCLGTIHALVTSIWGIGVELSTQPECDPQLWWIKSPMLILIGFLIVDLLSMIVCDIVQRWRPVDHGMLFHHVFIIVAFTVGYAYNTGVWFGTTLLVNECSTPFFTIFWYLQYTGQKESIAFTVNGLFFLVVFFICRILFIPVCVYQFASVGFCHESSNPTYHRWASSVMCMGYAAIYVLNLLWFAKLAKGAWRKLRGGPVDPYLQNVGKDHETDGYQAM